MATAQHAAVLAKGQQLVIDGGPVDYLLRGTAQAPGTYPGMGTVKVKTKTKNGYVVNGPGNWNITFKR